MALKTFLPQNFKLVTDASQGQKLDHENFICEKLFLSRIWQNCETFFPRNFRLHSICTLFASLSCQSNDAMFVNPQRMHEGYGSRRVSE